MDIVDISPRDDNTTLRLGRHLQSVSGKALCCALARDGVRAYLGGHSGVWRSDDGGATWRHLQWPEPPVSTTVVPGALLGTTIYDVLISTANPDLVFAAVGRDARSPPASGVWRSANGGATWTRVHQFVNKNIITGQVTFSQANCLAIAPDDPNLIFCAGGFAVARSTDGGLTWTDLFPQQIIGDNVWYVTVGPRQGSGRRVYAAGSRVWSSRDGGNTWQADTQPIRLGECGDGPGPSARSIGIHPADPRVLYVATFERNNASNNFEGIVRRGQFELDGTSAWRRLPPIPLNFPGVTASGAGFVVPHVAPDGKLYLVSSDRRTVHLSFGDPATAADWVRIEDARCHLDPHGLAMSRAFGRRQPGQPAPQTFGRILLVNDGGTNFSTDGAQTWQNGRGLSTLGVVNAAIAPRRDGGPAICMGMGDNFGFASPNGGDNWETQHYLGGDNDCAFADPREPRRVVVFAPRSGKGDGGVGRGCLHLYVSPDSNPPNTALGTPHVRVIPGAPPLASDILEALAAENPLAALNGLNAGWTAVSNYYNFGYRPLILTPRGQTPPADVDFVVIRLNDDGPELVRTTKLSLMTDAGFWQTSDTADGPNVFAFRPTPPLPAASINIVQASGGHASPTFYVGDQIFVTETSSVRGPGNLWRWTAGMARWQQIVPAQTQLGVPAPSTAQRFFVDPYRPNILYVLGSDHVYRSANGGATWTVDRLLERALTEDGAFPIVVPDDGNADQALLRDMLFDPARPKARFAIGPAGVFHTLDGVRWSALFRSSAQACRPNNAAYDFVSCPRALYVATSNRGLLRLSPLPPDWDYPFDSLQAAVGRIELLRVHDVGTGFGSPTDELDAEVIVMLDSELEKAFGFKLRPGADERVARGMLDLLRAAFERDRQVRLEFIRTGCRTGRIVRVIQL
jgi:photosystem II stability/assembly factor-like uncharacterized protein